MMALLRMRASASEQVDAIGLNEQRVPETREETCVCSVVCNAAAEGRALRPHLHEGKTQLFLRSLASHLHENAVFITENDHF